MKKAPYIAGLAVALVAVCVLQVAFAAKIPPPQLVPDQYIVVLKQSAAQPVLTRQLRSENRLQKLQMNQVARNGNLTKLKQVHGKGGIQETAIQHYFADAVVGFTAKMSKGQADVLRRDPDVEGIFQDMAYILEPILLEPIKLISTQTVTCAVEMAGGPLDGSTKPTWIWICDTGIDLDHPDLNVQTSATYAKSFVPGQTIEDGHGHGTHCAGIAAAKNNLFGVAGVSAGATVVPIKVLDNTGHGQFSWLLAALDHIAQFDIPNDVVSMSLGGYPVSNCVNYWPPLTAAIQNLGNAGTSVVIAAMNESDCNGANLSLPGCVNGNRVYTVGAITCNKTCADYSNFGPAVVDWVAVGSSVYSTYKNGGYATLSGTSMATPVVAGIIHSKNGTPPVSAGLVACCNAQYKIAKR